MNRRAFLATLAAGLAGAALDPERLLWKPGARTFFLPSTSSAVITLPPPVALRASGLLIGDVVTLNGVYAVNPVTRVATTLVQQFVVTGEDMRGVTLSPAAYQQRLTAGNWARFGGHIG